MSSLGDFVVSAGMDRSLRVWQRTEEPFFVEEEKEKRLESLFEADLEVRGGSLCSLPPDTPPVYYNPVGCIDEKDCVRSPLHLSILTINVARYIHCCRAPRIVQQQILALPHAH